MKAIYFTLVGTSYCHGKDFLEKGMEVVLEKEKDNVYDKEAIMVKMKGLGKVGYVANSPYTVQGESLSAGRLYDKISNGAMGKVMYVLSKGVLCQLIHTNGGGLILEDEDYSMTQYHTFEE